MNKPKTNRRELTLFLIVAFAVPYLMGIPLAFAQRAGQDTSLFANAQMMYPAAGVMLAFMAVRRTALPMRFYALHIVSTVACAVCLSLIHISEPTRRS